MEESEDIEYTETHHILAEFTALLLYLVCLDSEVCELIADEAREFSADSGESIVFHAFCDILDCI
jgi:hypothetical protein